MSVLLQCFISELLVAQDPLLSRMVILKPITGSSCKSNAFSHVILTNFPSFEVIMLPCGLGGKPATIKVSFEKEE